MNNVTACIFYSKNDAKLTGRSYRARGEKVLLLDSEYAEDTAILFDNHEDLTNDVNNIVTHFARFGMEVHTGKIEPRGESKLTFYFVQNSVLCTTTLIVMIMLIYLILLLVMIDIYQL